MIARIRSWFSRPPWRDLYAEERLKRLALEHRENELLKLVAELRVENARLTRDNRNLGAIIGWTQGSRDARAN